MNLKKLKIGSVVLAFLLSFPLHFIYDKFPCFISSIFFPVNESIWEHMKILFGALMIVGVIEHFLFTRKKVVGNNACFANFTAAILSIPMFLAMYLPVYHLIGEQMPITLSIMLITYFFCEIISYKIIKLKQLSFEYSTILFVNIIYIIFTFLTYYPPKINLFYDTKNNYYGIKK